MYEQITQVFYHGAGQPPPLLATQQREWPHIKEGQTTHNARKFWKKIKFSNIAKQRAVINMIFRHADSKSCLYFGWTLLSQGVLAAFLSNLMTFSIKLGSQIFQNNALVKVSCTLKLISTQEGGIKFLLLLLVLQENERFKQQK